MSIKNQEMLFYFKPHFFRETSVEHHKDKYTNLITSLIINEVMRLDPVSIFFSTEVAQGEMRFFKKVSLCFFIPILIFRTPLDKNPLNVVKELFDGLLKLAG